MGMSNHPHLFLTSRLIFSHQGYAQLRPVVFEFGCVGLVFDQERTPKISVSCHQVQPIQCNNTRAVSPGDLTISYLNFSKAVEFQFKYPAGCQVQPS